jgi:hypothetical protein
MKRTTSIKRLQILEERVQQLEEMLCLAKAKCKKCGATLVILPATQYLSCACGELFGDVAPLLGGVFDDINRLEWINKDGYEKELLMDYLRREVNSKYPAVLARTRIS